MKDKGTEILVGYCDVDAGLIMIGDPCYASVDGKDDSESRHQIHDWNEFCAWIHNDDEPFLFKAIPHLAGHEGGGVVVSSGFGDGSYPVYVTLKDYGAWGTRVTGLRISFVSEDE